MYLTLMPWILVAYMALRVKVDGPAVMVTGSLSSHSAVGSPPLQSKAKVVRSFWTLTMLAAMAVKGMVVSPALNTLSSVVVSAARAEVARAAPRAM